MWYEKAIIKILFAIAKFMALRSEKIDYYDIESLEREIFQEKETKEDKKDEEDK